MAIADEVDVPAGRALEELECARRATGEAAAAAHLELSELHLARIRAPAGPAAVLRWAW